MTNAYLTLHSEAIIIDGHCDSIGDQLEHGRWLGERSSRGMLICLACVTAASPLSFLPAMCPSPYQRHCSILMPWNGSTNCCASPTNFRTS